MTKGILLIVVTAGLFYCKQGVRSKLDAVNKETISTVKNVQNDDKDIYTKYEYIDPAGKRIKIQNGFPRGGVKYTNPDGKVCGYAVFWTRIINETDNSLELKIDPPINSYEISNFPSKYFRILVPTDTMTIDKFPLFLYGLKDIKSFLDNNNHKQPSFKRTINSNESSGFYFLMLVLTEEATGATRTELNLKGQDLFYKISRYSITKPITLIDEIEIKCGSINLKNLRVIK